MEVAKSSHTHSWTEVTIEVPLKKNYGNWCIPNAFHPSFSPNILHEQLPSFVTLFPSLGPWLPSPHPSSGPQSQGFPRPRNYQYLAYMPKCTQSPSRASTEDVCLANLLRKQKNAWTEDVCGWKQSYLLRGEKKASTEHVCLANSSSEMGISAVPLRNRDSRNTYWYPYLLNLSLYIPLVPSNGSSESYQHSTLCTSFEESYAQAMHEFWGLLCASYAQVLRSLICKFWGVLSWKWQLLVQLLVQSLNRAEIRLLKMYIHIELFKVHFD